MEPAPGWIALVTGIIVRALTPLPIHGLAVEGAGGGARRGRRLPVSDLGVTGRGLRTANGLV